MVGYTLFAEDFDLPPTGREPAAVEPVFSAADLAAAREAAWQEGHAAGLHEAAESYCAALRRAVVAIADWSRQGTGKLCTAPSSRPTRSHVC